MLISLIEVLLKGALSFLWSAAFSARLGVREPTELLCFGEQPGNSWNLTAAGNQGLASCCLMLLTLSCTFNSLHHYQSKKDFVNFIHIGAKKIFRRQGLHFASTVSLHVSVTQAVAMSPVLLHRAELPNSSSDTGQHQFLKRDKPVGLWSVQSHHRWAGERMVRCGVLAAAHQWGALREAEKRKIQSLQKETLSTVISLQHSLPWDAHEGRAKIWKGIGNASASHGCLKLMAVKTGEGISMQSISVLCSIHTWLLGAQHHCSALAWEQSSAQAAAGSSIPGGPTLRGVAHQKQACCSEQALAVPRHA